MFRTLFETNMIVDRPAFELLGKLRQDLYSISLDLVMLHTLTDLGFLGGATRNEIYAKAESMNYMLCPGETGPILRPLYQNQPKDSWINIAMDPILRDGVPLIFALTTRDHSNGALCTAEAGKYTHYDEDTWWVFCRENNSFYKN